MNMTPNKIRFSMSQSDEIIAERVLYELWYSVAETIFERVCEVTQLDEEQKEALRLIALRPNDFHIVLTDE